MTTKWSLSVGLQTPLLILKVTLANRFSWGYRSTFLYSKLIWIMTRFFPNSCNSFDSGSWGQGSTHEGFDLGLPILHFLALSNVDKILGNTHGAFNDFLPVRFKLEHSLLWKCSFIDSIFLFCQLTHIH